MSEESSADYLARVRAEWEPESAQDRIAALKSTLTKAETSRDVWKHSAESNINQVDDLRKSLQKAERERDDARAQSERLRVEVNKGAEAFFKIAAIRTRFEEDNATLREKLAESGAYADKLAAGLPMLPADIENLRNANFEFAKENDELRAQVAGLAGALKSTLPHLADIRANAEGWDTTEEIDAAMEALARHPASAAGTQPEP